MTKAELLRRLEKVPDDAVILAPGDDHSYQKVAFDITTAIYSPDSRTFSEDHGDEYMEDGDKRINAVVFG